MVGLEAFGQQVKTAKWIQNLLYDMDRIIPYLENPFVTDIAIGKAGELIVEGIGMEKNFTGIFFSDAETTSIINTSAAILGVNIDPNNPTVEGVIPLPQKKDEVTSSDEFWNIRVEGILPSRAVGNPMYFIRRPSDKVFPLQSYLESNRITK